MTHFLDNFLKIILFLAALGLRCCSRAFSSGSKWVLLSRYGVQVSHRSGFSCCQAPARELWCVGLGLPCSAACGVFPDQGSTLCLLHRQADSSPLSHQGSRCHSLLSDADAFFWATSKASSLPPGWGLDLKGSAGPPLRFPGEFHLSSWTALTPSDWPLQGIQRPWAESRTSQVSPPRLGPMGEHSGPVVTDRWLQSDLLWGCPVLMTYPVKDGQGEKCQALDVRFQRSAWYKSVFAAVQGIHAGFGGKYDRRSGLGKLSPGLPTSSSPITTLSGPSP